MEDRTHGSHDADRNDLKTPTSSVKCSLTFITGQSIDDKVLKLFTHSFSPQSWYFSKTTQKTTKTVKNEEAVVQLANLPASYCLCLWYGGCCARSCASAVVCYAAIWTDFSAFIRICFLLGRWPSGERKYQWKKLLSDVGLWKEVNERLVI